ncbi:tetratricopeptide repeat protein [Nocardia sp. NPDC058058]|uniref:tetratricopeptide repeat protein n=1 Tax=Nocardia sp. NPDC058058 TaxID=3346317 RepID=UPI0036D9F4BB
MDSRIERAWVLINLGRLESAREMLAEMLAGEPENGQALAAMADVMYQMDDFERSLGYSAAGLRVWPDSSFLWRSRALAYWRLGSTGTSSPEVYGKRNASALAAAQRAVELDPDDIDNLRILAVTQRRSDPEAALAALDRALEINSEIPEIHLVRAMVLRQLRWREDVLDEQAEASFNEVLRLDPDNAAATFELGLIENRRGQLERALERFHMSARLDPRFAENARTNIARIERQLSRARAAAADSGAPGVTAPTSLAPTAEPAAPEKLPAEKPTRIELAPTQEPEPTPEPEPAAEPEHAREAAAGAARLRDQRREGLRYEQSGAASDPEPRTATPSRRWGRSALLLIPILLFVRLVASGCSADASEHQPVRPTGPAPLFPITDPAIKSGLRSFPSVVLVPHG